MSDGRGLATGRLADLARAGFLGLRLPSMRVEYEIHHLVDGPGRLVQILDGGAGGFVETLSAGGHGVGVVVGTRVAEQLAHTTWSPASPTPDATALTFRGSARPNPTFQHRTADRFDAVVCIEDEPRRVTLRHGAALRDALAEVARIAVQEHVPLLSLQCPAQIPPHTSRRAGGAGPARTVDSSRSSSLALRFSMALARPRAEARLRIAERLAGYCRDRGLGLWLADTRAGYRDGDWFIVASHDRSAARRAYPSGVPGNAAEGCLPITLVGPARPGSTHAVAAYLARHPSVGVLACSMTALDDLAFVHLQLAVNGASLRRLSAINRAIAGYDGRAGRSGCCRTCCRSYCAAPPTATSTPPGCSPLPRTTRSQSVPRSRSRPVGARSAYRSGSPSPCAPTPRGPICGRCWARSRGRWTRSGSSHRAVRPSIEYLVCRLVEPSRLAGKGKLAVDRDELVARFPASRSTGSAGRLCNALESAWRTRLAADADGVGVTLSVSWRESWLEHWT